MTPIADSSLVEAFEYNGESRDLTLALKHGTYVYHDVPPALVQEFTEAESAGKFFSQRIKGHFHYDKKG